MGFVGSATLGRQDGVRLEELSRSHCVNPASRRVEGKGSVLRVVSAMCRKKEWRLVLFAGILLTWVAFIG